MSTGSEGEVEDIEAAEDEDVSASRFLVRLVKALGKLAQGWRQKEADRG